MYVTTGRRAAGWQGGWAAVLRAGSTPDQPITRLPVFSEHIAKKGFCEVSHGLQMIISHTVWYGILSTDDYFVSIV